MPNQAQRYRYRRPRHGAHAKVTIVTTEHRTRDAMIPDFSVHAVFWLDGRKWQTKPIHGFASKAAARDEGIRRLQEFEQLRAQIEARTFNP